MNNHSVDGGDGGTAVGRVRRPRGESRRLLLEVASEVFVAKGFAGSSTREIADRAGVSETLMFRYFGSKVGLFREALVAPFAEFVRSFNERWELALTDGFDVERLTRTFIGEMYDLFSAHRGLVVILWSADAQADNELAEFGVFDEVVERLQTLVELGTASAAVADGFMSPPHHLLTRSTLSMVAGMAVFGRSFYGDSRPARSDIIEALTLISLRAHVPGTSAVADT